MYTRKTNDQLDNLRVEALKASLYRGAVATTRDRLLDTYSEYLNHEMAQPSAPSLSPMDSMNSTDDNGSETVVWDDNNEDDPIDPPDGTASDAAIPPPPPATKHENQVEQPIVESATTTEAKKTTSREVKTTTPPSVELPTVEQVAPPPPGSTKHAEPTTQAKALAIALTVIYFPLIWYEMARYHGIALVNRLLERTGKCPSWREPAEHVDYSLLGHVGVAHPKWYFSLRHYMFYVILWTVCFWLYFSVWLSMGQYAKGQLVPPEMKALYMTEPLEPENMADYINDFADTKPMSEQSVEELRNYMDAVNDADNDSEREFLAEFDLDDEDGNGIPDVAQADSRRLVTFALKKGLGLKNLQGMLDSRTFWGNGETGTTTTYLPAIPRFADEIMPPEKQVCGYYGQYMRTTHSIVLKTGCTDVTKYYLDSIYNPLYQCVQNNNQQRQAAAGKISREEAGAVKQAEDDCKELLRQEEERKRNGKSEMPCVCNTHYAQTGLWAYTTLPGHESMFFSNYKIVAMNYTDFIKLNSGGELASGGGSTLGYESTDDSSIDASSSSEQNYRKNVHNLMRQRGIKESETTSLGKTDHAFWQAIQADSLVDQPVHAYLIETDVLPSETTLREYYGDTYGPSEDAFVNAFALVHHERKNSTHKHMGFVGTLNSIGHWFNIYNEDLSIIDEVTIKIGQKRTEMASTRRKAAHEALSNTNSTEMETLTRTLYHMAGFHYESDGQRERLRILSLEPPKMTRKKIIVKEPFSRCFTKCLHAQNLLLTKRQEYYERQNKLPVADPERYSIRPEDFVKVMH